MAARPYDVVLYGAAGFTGRQTAEYFARRAPPALRWAIAGRHRDRLEAVRTRLDTQGRIPDLLVADSNDQVSVDALVRQAHVVLSTAGPFALYGTPVVDACVRFGTHYVDITGEIAWVRELITRYHDRAAAGGTRIVVCAGFDSIPSDLGTFLIARHMQREMATDCRDVRGYFRLKGGLNGGTIASLLNMMDSRTRGQPPNPFVIDAGDTHSRTQAAQSGDLRAVQFDDTIGAWVGPFVMAQVNTRVVRRSASLFQAWGEPYGPDFVYTEAAKYEPPLALVKATLSTAVLGVFYQGLKRPVSRRLLTPLLPKPGTGPSMKTMNEGWFSCELIGTGTDGRRVDGVIAFQGDPGNRATTVLVCESALALALDADRLPGAPRRGGILTPATALGDVLAGRLRRADVRIEVPATARPPHS